MGLVQMSCSEGFYFCQNWSLIPSNLPILIQVSHDWLSKLFLIDKNWFEIIKIGLDLNWSQLDRLFSNESKFVKNLPH